MQLDRFTIVLAMLRPDAPQLDEEAANALALSPRALQKPRNSALFVSPGTISSLRWVWSP